jgi:RND family efflux transporter MFP subunit
MKNQFFIILTLLLVSCGGGSDKSLQDIINSKDLKTIRAKKNELVSEQKELNTKIGLLDEEIAKLDKVKRVSLVTTLTIKEQVFNHYLELQGNVTTKDLLVLYPEYSGTLTEVHVKNGQKVKKGQLLAIIDDGGLKQQLTQLQIQEDLAKTTYERQKRLWDQKIGSEMQFLQAKSNYEAQSKAVDQLEQQVEKTMVRAPFSGTIDDVISERGTVVMQGQTELMRIINLSNMYIESDVPEKHITNISKNKSVIVEFPILGKSVNSKVREVGNYINPANRTFKVEVAIPNSDKYIKPNLTAKLKINDYTNNHSLLVPQNIISENSAGQQYVYIVKNKQENGEAIAQKTIIQTGRSQGDLIEVLEGLYDGAEIIIEGARSVNDAQVVKILNI